MKVHPDSISPEAWMLPNRSSVFLVCGKRYTRGRPATGAPRAETRSFAHFPVAIELMPLDRFDFPAGWIEAPTPLIFPIGNFRVKLNVVLPSGQWQRFGLEGKDERGSSHLLLGIKPKSARLALAEAYRAVTSAVIDLEKIELKVSFKVEMLWTYKGGTPGRNIAACLLWDYFERDGVGEDDRAEILDRVVRKDGVGEVAKWEGRALSEWAKKVGL